MLIFLRNKWKKVLVILSFIVLCFVALLRMPFRFSTLYELSASEEITIFLGHNGVHIDFVLDRNTFFKESRLDWGNLQVFYPEKSWVSIGWGDYNFFVNHDSWATIGVKDMLQAAFASQGSALRMSFTGDLNGKEFVELHLTTEQLQLIIASIDASLPGHVPPKLERIDEENYRLIFKSNDSYRLTHNCNHWTAEVLGAANLPTPLVVTTSTSIMRYYRHDRLDPF